MPMAHASLSVIRRKRRFLRWCRRRASIQVFTAPTARSRTSGAGFVQGLLALVSFSALIFKRFCEPKSARRPWLIWFYDTSKQGLGALLIHFANVLLSDAFKGDPCTWYIVSFLLDSTLGLVIIYLGLKASQCVFVRMLGWMKFQLGAPDVELARVLG
ncbi:PREDICTED: store-operated calcium entry regulator STIMATE-like [Priapulus caudatus]|uniref:Store-operated calcium entry regulator STIMATE-like n=1 Tax=Priapulus caudatus TaxID=37621 RepID=A0ABM1EWU5_PRICU|nr:PREDICTED: store-operated calcium entry regulator STIMATE-like [Priapulus caudatus]